MLSTIVPRAGGSVLSAQYLLERGVDLFKLACEQNLEGIAAKLAQSPYALLDGRRRG